MYQSAADSGETTGMSSALTGTAPLGTSLCTSRCAAAMAACRHTSIIKGCSSGCLVWILTHAHAHAVGTDLGLQYNLRATCT